MGLLQQYLNSRYANPEARENAPSSTVEREESKLALSTPSTTVPPTYQEAVLQEKNTVRFSATLATPVYEGYIKISPQEVFGDGFIIPPVVDYLVTENNNFLITENNNNLII